MQHRSVLFLNQVAGPLFRELAEDVARELSGAELFTGHASSFSRSPHPALRVISAPAYDRSSVTKKIWSWIRYFFSAAFYVFKDSKDPLLFIVSNPPFLPAIGWMAAVLRGQRYCVLVYDLYPGIMIRLGRITEHGLIATLWRIFNRIVWSRASMVYTIGDYMAENIRREAKDITGLRIRVIPNWVDTEFIRPLPKMENSFLKSLGWNDGRTVVLYSGNLGDTHNLNSLIAAAVSMKERSDLGFLIIGSGARWTAIQDEIQKHNISNVKLLPFQPEEILPQTLPAGDIAVVAMESATAGYMVPSKTYYYLAAGAAILALVPPKSEIGELVESSGCGITANPESSHDVQIAINRFLREPVFLTQCQNRARKLAVDRFGRSNTVKYVESIKLILNQNH